MLPVGAVVQPVEGGNELTVSGVILPSGAPVAAFLADPTSGTAPLTVTFTDQSTGTGMYMWNWSFGDNSWYNTTNVNLKNPVHTYAGPGTYLARLTVCNAGSCDTTSPGTTITALPSTSSLTVTSPNGGEMWKRGNPYPIRWSYRGSPGSLVNIVLFQGNTQVYTIASSVSIGNDGSGSFNWNIPADKPLSNEYKVRVQSISQPDIKDLSDNQFSIVADTPPTTSITVTSPDGGETWKRGTAHTITWSYTGNPGSTVKIVLLKEGVEAGTIASSVPVGSGGKGSYTWPISSSGYTGNYFKVSIQSISQPAIKDVSDNYFIITPTGTTTPSITVTSPNGGESWKRGTTHTITWSYTGSPGSTVKIMLYKAGTYVGTITPSTPIGSGGKGSYTWPVSSTGSTGNDFKVGIQSISQPAVTDTSNTVFTLLPRISVQKPVALFSQDTYYGKPPLTVHFTDRSRNNPTSYFWRFGDGSSSTEKNPTHKFTQPGFYIVQEQVTNAAGSDLSYSAVVVTRTGGWWSR